MERSSALSSTLAPNPKFLRRTIELAVQNVRRGTGGPFGALIVRDGVIVAEATNSVTTSLDPTAHAEVNAIRAACRELGTFQLSDCQIYTSCEPCAMCLAACYWARLAAVFYGAGAADAARAGFDDAKIYEELSREGSVRALRAEQLLRDEAWSAFAAWLGTPIKTLY